MGDRAARRWVSLTMATNSRLVDPREYRRGVVLGLTLAEILVLLVFLLLLSMAALLLRRDQEQGALTEKLGRYDALLRPVTEALARRGVVVKNTDQLASLIERGAAADGLRSQLAEALTETEGMRRERQNQDRELSQLRHTAQSVARDTAAATDYAVLAAILDRAPGSSSQPLPEKLTRLIQQAATAGAASASLTGQNAQMRSELTRLKGNGGSGLPYCWALPDGRAQYMLKVEMQDTGVVVHDLEPRARPEDSAWLLLDGVPRGRLMAMDEFIGQTSPLQGRSTTDRCRYAIQVVDGTGVTNKPGYKRSMGRLWSVFMVHEVGR